jgi:peptidyl-prolyl cis-trans isomerase C
VSFLRLKQEKIAQFITASVRGHSLAHIDGQDGTLPLDYRQELYCKGDVLFSMPDRVHCAHILVKTETEAKNVKARLDKGEKFAALAKDVSLCPSGKKGGDLGTFARGKMVKEFEKAAFTLEKGQTSAPVKTQFGYHVIKRLE